MTLPSWTTAMATPGTFHCFMALAARSSRPWSFEAGDAAVAAAAGAAGFFLGVWAKLGDAKNIADKITASVGLRMMFLSVTPIQPRIRGARQPDLHGRVGVEKPCRKWALPESRA